jgi:hypothetical protein
MQVLSQSPPFPVRRLVEFAERRADDVCLQLSDQPVFPRGPRVRTATASTALPDGPFTLVIAVLALTRAADPAALAAEMLRVCRGRLVLAELVRTHEGDPMGGRESRQGLIELITLAGGRVRRLEAFTIERPLEPWLAQAGNARHIRRALAAEIDGGPSTGARPRLIGEELWFSQSWAYLAAEPRGPEPPRR